tara:strand:+ start:262 stop:1263 length:1002 start_codon:yes stop_codon:yes gene_type:complete
MIVKSFLVENNIKLILDYNFILLYGENSGLISEIKKKILTNHKNDEIINIYQEDINKNKDIILEESKNVSLFATNKIIFINQSNDKIFNDISYLHKNPSGTKIILISDILDKKSKIRNFFEKENNFVVVPCYNDNEITLKRIITTELKNYNNLNSNIINLIINCSNLNRNMVISNILKIKTYFDNKIIQEDQLEKLLNTDRNELFEKIRDSALMGDKIKLNQLLNNFSFSKEDSFMYLNVMNSKLLKLLEIHNNKASEESIETTMSKIRPPIFWKDKPLMLNLLKKWNKRDIQEAIIYLSKIDKICKINSGVNALTIIQNSITNLCSRSWTYF